MKAAMSELELIPFRQLLDHILVPARRHFRQVFLPIAVPMATCGVLAAVMQIGWFKAMAGGELTAAIPFLATFALVFFAILGVYGLGFSALMVASLDAVAGRPVRMGRAWIWPLSPRVFLTLLAVSVIHIISFMMCLLPVLYVAPIFSFVFPVMVEERQFGWAAIRRSYQLTHTTPTGRWLDSMWPRILAFLVVGMVITYAVSLSVQLPFLIVQQVLIFRDAAAGQIADPMAAMSGSFWLQVPAQILGAFASTAVWLYWTFGISLLYRETRRRYEGADLRQAIDELTGAQA